ncbi:MAG: zinc ribbon domain-containing protein [Spirochaetales bacterium]|nr:zinc ribbon domain-containing protein [Spirochaetales bacterium]
MGFFCDNCGGEVDLHDEFCTHCGADFEGIRCPSCRFSGPPQKFINGCPKCGYQKRNDVITEKPLQEEKETGKSFTANPPGIFYRIAIPLLSILLIVLLLVLFLK